MIREANVRDVKVINTYPGAVENEVDLPHWRMAGVGGRVTYISAFETSGTEKESEFPVPPEGVEVTGDDDFFVGFLCEVV